MGLSPQDSHDAHWQIIRRLPFFFQRDPKFSPPLASAHRSSSHNALFSWPLHNTATQQSSSWAPWKSWIKIAQISPCKALQCEKLKEICMDKKTGLEFWNEYLFYMGLNIKSFKILNTKRHLTAFSELNWNKWLYLLQVRFKVLGSLRLSLKMGLRISVAAEQLVFSQFSTFTELERR